MCGKGGPKAKPPSTLKIAFKNPYLATPHIYQLSPCPPPFYLDSAPLSLTTPFWNRSTSIGPISATDTHNLPAVNCIRTDSSHGWPKVKETKCHLPASKRYRSTTIVPMPTLIRRCRYRPIRMPTELCLLGILWNVSLKFLIL